MKNDAPAHFFCTPSCLSPASSLRCHLLEIFTPLLLAVSKTERLQAGDQQEPHHRIQIPPRGGLLIHIVRASTVRHRQLNALFEQSPGKMLKPLAFLISRQISQWLLMAGILWEHLSVWRAADSNGTMAGLTAI